MLSDKRIVVTGGHGFLGSYVVDELRNRGCKYLGFPTHDIYDLRERSSVRAMMRDFKPDVIIHAAAHCGGIGLNKERPAELFYDNMMMGLLMIDEAHEYGVEKFVQLGTVCEYPKFAKAPFLEEEIWNGYPEETNAPYGIAKKALLVQGQAYRQQYGFNVIHLLPVNLYGPRDNFNPASSHVIPALIRRFAEAKQQNLPGVEIWGTGRASREFLYVKDAAEAIVDAVEQYNSADPINIGTGSEITVDSLVSLIANKIGYQGQIIFDFTKPDGQPRRCLDTQKARDAFGFLAKTGLEEGLDKTIDWYMTSKKTRFPEGAEL
jgi:GDP-L-fucose synthase